MALQEEVVDEERSFARGESYDRVGDMLGSLDRRRMNSCL